MRIHREESTRSIKNFSCCKVTRSRSYEAFQPAVLWSAEIKEGQRLPGKIITTFVGMVDLNSLAKREIILWSAEIEKKPSPKITRLGLPSGRNHLRRGLYVQDRDVADNSVPLHYAIVHHSMVGNMKLNEANQIKNFLSVSTFIKIIKYSL